MRSKVWKRMSEILLVLIFISIFILLELRIIQKPYKWIVFDVTRNKYTTYDKDNDVYVGLPTVLNRNGADKKIYITLNLEETNRLQKSIDLIRDAIASIKK